MHIVPVELSKPKNDTDFDRMCGHIYGGTFDDAPDPGVTDFEYPMDDCILRLTPLAALDGYVMRCRGVRCSTDYSMRGMKYRLRLRGPLALFGVESAAIVPGYVIPRNVG